MKRIILTMGLLMLALAMGIKAQTPTEMPTGKKFHIQSAMNYGKNNGGYWDVPGYPKEIQKGSNIQVYDFDDNHDRKFSMHFKDSDGYYEIKVGNTTNARIDIQGGKKGNGTSVKTWERNNKSNQKFLFKHLGNGRFKIYDKNSGKVICLAGRSSSNRSNVHIWDDHKGPWMEWYLIDVKTKKAFVPKPVSKTPDFFIDNKNFVLKYSYMTGSSDERKAVVESVKGNTITVRDLDKNRELKIEYKDGKYIYDPGGLYSSRLSDDGKRLSFSGEYGLDFIVSAPHASQTPDFFINNKKFKYETASMVSRSEGTATVESINGNKIILRVVGTSHNSDVPPGHPKESDFDRKIEVTFEDGKYLYMPDVFSKGEISNNGKTLSFSGPGYIGFTVDD
ncbi:MAG: RICIN domain-containing protein [Perlabentimonas sp.]